MIRILPPEVANRIAAGEVVERPASVVRELIDNAIDAGARRIQVDVSAGGTERVRVTDDGCGMNREDALLCTRRHATSKIESADDLERITTMGFRGEALASIASVSEFELVTRRPECKSGYRVTSRGGDDAEIEEVGAPAGTRVTIAQLFDRVPARKKFLKRSSTELQHIINTVTWAALAHESIHFSLNHNDRRVFEYSAAPDRLHRIRQVIGNDVVESLVPVSLEIPAVRISGFISRPAMTRPNGQQVQFFVNDRFVRDRLIHRALMDGYRNMLPPRRYPVVFLFLELDPHQVDVNVHPTKQEVRFQNESSIFSAVHSAVRGAWESTSDGGAVDECTPPLEETPPDSEPRPQSVPHPSPPAARHSTRGADGLQTAGALLGKPEPPRPFRPGPDRWNDGTPVRSMTFSQPEVPQPEIPRQGAPNEPDGAPRAPGEISNPTLLDSALPSSVDVHDEIRVRGQLLDSYILAESEKGLVIIDQHAAHERIRFEELYAAWKKRQIASQCLLIPIAVDLPPAQMETIEEHARTLLSFGLEVEPFGQGTVSIRSIPHGISLESGEELLKDILSNLTGDPGVDGDGEDARAVRALYTVACRSAVKFGDRLSMEEMQSIVDRLATVPRRDVCPHGRPAVLAIREKDLRRAFDRG